MVFSRPDGTVLDHPGLLMAGVGGGDPRAVREDELIPLPRGSDMFSLPGRRPVGIDPDSGEAEVWSGDGEEVFGVAAFLAPAWTLFLHPAYATLENAPALPLYAYGTVGFADGQFWATGVRVDEDIRQDPWRFDPRRLRSQVRQRLAEMPGNRVAASLERCALEYNCRAAQNYFIGRHEAPLPTSASCNSRCLGCISLQPDGQFPASHERVRGRLAATDVAAVALDHIKRVPDGVVSFGQGCEGEPLMAGDLLVETVSEIRRQTDNGTINLNSNGSLPDVVARMCAAGLDALRVSINSVRRPIYDAYYRPVDYHLDDVVRSLQIMRDHGGLRAINYLVFPGVTDTDEELTALELFIQDVDLEMIQMRNLNIDPEVYEQQLPADAVHEGMGMARFMARLKERFPDLRFGYFNPSRQTYQAWRLDRDAQGPLA
jgi:wyosine [tRNA(Phe)-imidazoG37] synthetase (radical SAM superfamily)